MNLKKYNYSREAIILLVMHSLYTLGTALTSVFLNIFLWKLGNSVSINAAYNLIAFGTMVFACILGGRLTKKFGKVTVYRIGICLISLFFASILILKQNVIDYYHGIAVLHGIGLALYWMGHALITYDVTTEDNRMKYISISFVINTTLSIIGPSLAGNIIVNQNEMKGYYIIFMAALTLFFITALGSLWLNNKSKNEKFLLKYMGLLMKKNPNWFVVLIGWFIIGLLHGLMYFLTDILLFRSLGKEDYVGYMSMTLLIISVITSFIMSYNTKQNAQKNYIYTSSIGYAIISLLLIFWSNNIVIIIFLILYFIFVPLQQNTYSNHNYNTISKLPLKGKLLVESIVMYEIFLNTGKMTSLILFLMLVDNMEDSWIVLVLIFVLMSQLSLIWIIQFRSSQKSKSKKRQSFTI